MQLIGASMILSAVQRDEYGSLTHYQQSSATGYGVIVNQAFESGTHRLQSLRMDRPNVTTPEVNTTFSYNPAGQMTSAADIPDPATPARTDPQCYKYDTLGRLSEAWSNGATTCAATPAYVASGAAPYWTSWTLTDGGKRLSERVHAASSTNDTLATYTYPAANVSPTTTTPTPAHAPSKVTRKVGTATAVDYPLTYDAAGRTKLTPRDRPVVFDISGIPDTKGESRAAAQLASWAAASEMMDTSDALTTAGLEPRRHYLSIDDELWSGLRASSGMVDRYDAITRLNRSMGIGQVMVSHTSSDLAALPEVDRAKAAGFIDRAGIVVCAGLPASEFEQPAMAGRFTRAERDLVTKWQTPSGWETNAAPPGRGLFLIKVGERPGIPVEMRLTAPELELHDTNSRWHDQSRRSSLHPTAGPAAPVAPDISYDTEGTDRSAAPRPPDLSTRREGGS